MFQFRLLFPPIQLQMLLLLLFGAITVNGIALATPKDVLMMAPNVYSSHFALNWKLAEALAAQHWVGNVHLLIIEKHVRDRDKSLVFGPKLTPQYFNPNEIWQREEPHQSKSKHSWSPRCEPKIVSPCSDSEELISKFASKKEEVRALQTKRFDIGIAEAFDYAAFPLLRLIGVRHMVATLNMPIWSIFYEIMDSQYLQKIIDQGDIPELWSTLCDDHLITNDAAQFGQMHKKSIEAAVNRYADADIKFGKIYDAYKETEPLTSHSEKLSIFQQFKLKKKPKPHVDEPIPIPEYRPIRQLLRESAHFFVNTQPFVDFPMPPGLPEKFAFIGGITFAGNNAVSSGERKHLNSDESWLNDILPKHLVAKKDKLDLVLVSFGTMVSFEDGPLNLMSVLLGTFISEAFHNYVFVVKSDKEINKYYGGNIVYKQWLPQKEMLASGHIKLFISHCGINSVLEAAHNGVPLLCVPFFADQYYNSEAMAKRGAAVVFNRADQYYNAEAMARRGGDAVKKGHGQERMFNMEGMKMQEIAVKAFSSKLHEALKDSYKTAMEAIQNELVKTKPMEEFLKRMSGLN